MKLPSNSLSILSQSHSFPSTPLTYTKGIITSGIFFTQLEKAYSYLCTHLSMQIQHIKLIVFLQVCYSSLLMSNIIATCPSMLSHPEHLLVEFFVSCIGQLCMKKGRCENSIASEGLPVGSCLSLADSSGRVTFETIVEGSIDQRSSMTS